MPSCISTNTGGRSLLEHDGRGEEITLRRFGFAVVDSGSKIKQTKRRRAVFEYVDGWLESGTIVDEWGEDNVRWLVVDVAAAIPLQMAQRFAEACPHVVRGSFRADRAR
jgi:tRNA(Met) C34 N-acetyltransferase TmcA